VTITNLLLRLMVKEFLKINQCVYLEKFQAGGTMSTQSGQCSGFRCHRVQWDGLWPSFLRWLLGCWDASSTPV